MRKLIFSVAFLSALFASCKVGKDGDKAITLVMSEVNPPETIAGQMDQAFKRAVEDLSGGKIKIDLHCSGELGDVEYVMELMTKPGSNIHIHRMSAVNMASYGCKKTSLLGIPYTFTSKEHFWNFAASDKAKELLNEPAELGLRVKGLFFAEEGFRHFFSTTKIEKVEDFKGLMVRGTNDAAMQGLLTDFGAVSVQVNYADLYDRLQRGVIGAAEQPIANYLGKRFYEVAPYIVLDGHTLGVMEPVITLEAWNSLSDRQQKILLEAGRYASEVCRRFSTSEENRIKRELVKENATITEVTDKEPWQKACERVIKDACAVDSASYEKILSYAPRL